jgi:hypothetical protein
VIVFSARELNGRDVRRDDDGLTGLARLLARKMGGGCTFDLATSLTSPVNILQG